MSDYRIDIDAALAADEPIAKDDVMRWIEAVGGLIRGG